jgi:hypothetical protein
LLEERQRLVHASEARIRRSQGGRDERPQAGDRLGRLTRQAELEDRDGTGEVSLKQTRAPEAPSGHDQAVARIASFGDVQRRLGDGQPLVELATLGKAQGEPCSSQHGGQPDHIRVVIGLPALQHVEVLTEGVHCARVLAERMIGLTDPQIRRQGQVESPGGRPRSQLSPSGRDHVLVVAHPPESAGAFESAEATGIAIGGQG